jgi:hypothetical protein
MTRPLRELARQIFLVGVLGADQTYFPSPSPALDILLPADRFPDFFVPFCEDEAMQIRIAW